MTEMEDRKPQAVISKNTKGGPLSPSILLHSSSQKSYFYSGRSFTRLNMQIGNREHQRYTHFLDVVLESSSGKIEARISEIGLGGCYVDTIVTVYEGDEVFFHLGPPFDENLRFAGTVAYVFPGMGFGIKFKDITDRHLALLSQIVKPSGE